MAITIEQNKIRPFLRGTALAGLCAIGMPVHALVFEKGEWLFNVDTALGLAFQWRTESRDKNLSETFDVENYNDGNNNFDVGSLVSGKGSFTLDLGAEYKDLSLFVRLDGLYDYVYSDWESDISDANYRTYNGAIPNGGNVRQGDFPQGTIDEQGQRTRLLEAFANYSFQLGDQSGSVRFGRQVIAWGEATMYQGVNALQNPFDGGVALSPGVDIKAIFLPTGAIDFKWAFTDSISAEAYYKLEWEETIQPGVGSYLSSVDLTGPGAQRILLGPLGTAPVVKAVEPDDDGQWGLALRYMTENGTSIDGSYTRSHANVPGSFVSIDLAGADSFARDVYLSDIDVWQISIAGNIGQPQVYLDLAYSDNAPFVDTAQFINDDGRLIYSDMARGHYWQAVVGMTDRYTAFTWLSERITLVAEAMIQGNNLGGDEFEDTTYVVTDTAWGYQFRATAAYFSVIPGMDLDATLSFRHDVDGYGNGNVMGNLLKEDQKNASFGFDGFYLTNWQFSAKYSWYFGNDNPEDRVISDRDNISISMTYTF